MFLRNSGSHQTTRHHIPEYISINSKMFPFIFFSQIQSVFTVNTQFFCLP
jgi:hypothetical protein